MEMPIQLKPRDYQQSIFETAKDANTLVVLPTGVGKTLIALMLAIQRQKDFPGEKVVMLAPTKPLVEQHYNSFKKELPELFAELTLFTGAVPAKQRRKLWDTADIIFSTPQCVANDLSNYLYDLKNVSLLIIDEAHRCLKNYDYTKVADFYKRQAENPRTLGLTASPGSEIEKVKQICKHLNIEEVESRTRDSADVKPYLQELEFEKVTVPFPAEFMTIKMLLKNLYEEKVNRIRNYNLIHGPINKITLLNLQKQLGAKVSGGDRTPIYFLAMSLTAQAIKISHAIELLETQTLASLKDYLQNLAKQAEQKKSKGVQQLVKSKEFQSSFTIINDLMSKSIEHPKLEELKVLVENEFAENKKFKAIVFVQFRETASLISKTLNSIPKLKAKLFVGQAKKSNVAGKTTGLNQKEQKQVVDEFREGKINVLVATSIGEEGLDIPEVSAVYFYETIPSAIRKIQRAGRTARLAPGKLFILITKNTRDEIYHYASSARERKMHKTLTQVQDHIKNQGKTLDDF